MTLDQKKSLRLLLEQSIEHGFGALYPLAAIAEKLSCSRETIKVWIDLGLAKMRRGMERSPLPLAA